MDFGGRQPDRGVSRTTTTTPSKRQRDYQEQLTQEKPPQTRRMMGMGLGDLVVESRSRTSCSRSSSSSSSSSAPSGGLFSTGKIDLPAAESKSSLMLSPLKQPPALNAISPSTSSDSAIPPQGMSTPPAVASAAGSEEAAGGSSAPGGSFIFQSVSGGSSCVPQTKKSKSTSSAAGEEVAVGAAAGGGGAGAGGSSIEPPPNNPWVCTVEGEVVDDNELGHRMSYLQMRGYDRAILDLMDESLQGIYEESDFADHEEDHDSHTDKVETESAIVVEVVSYGPCDIPPFAQPAVVTPERA